MRRHSLGLGLFVLGIFFAQPVAAASLYIDPAVSSLGRGDSVTMSVRLDTDEANQECVNAVDGVINYPDSILAEDVSIGESIFSVWVEPPKVDKIKHQITFAGGVPNGYCGRIAGDPRLTNTIVKLIFRSPGFSVGASNATSTAQVDFGPETTAYLNDGQGTKAQLALYGAKIDLGNRPSPVLQDAWHQEIISDDVAPEQFSIDIHKDEKTFAGEYYIVFNAIDKQTGIDQYEVIEEPVSRLKAFDWGRADAPWIVTRSPYVLKDQSLNSIIRVKATDKAGNEYIATLIPDKNMRTISTQDIIIIGGGLLLLLILISMLIVSLRGYRKRRRRIIANNSGHAKD